MHQINTFYDVFSENLFRVAFHDIRNALQMSINGVLYSAGVTRWNFYPCIPTLLMTVNIYFVLVTRHTQISDYFIENMNEICSPIRHNLI